MEKKFIFSGPLLPSFWAKRDSTDDLLMSPSITFISLVKVGVRVWSGGRRDRGVTGSGLISGSQGVGTMQW
jgi:hypothetical protein